MPFSMRVRAAKRPAGPMPTTMHEGDEDTSGKETGFQVFLTSSPTKSLTLRLILISTRRASILFLSIFTPVTLVKGRPHLDAAFFFMVLSSKASCGVRVRSMSFIISGLSHSSAIRTMTPSSLFTIIKA